MCSASEHLQSLVHFFHQPVQFIVGMSHSKMGRKIGMTNSANHAFHSFDQFLSVVIERYGKSYPPLEAVHAQRHSFRAVPGSGSILSVSSLLVLVQNPPVKA